MVELIYFELSKVFDFMFLLWELIICAANFSFYLNSQQLNQLVVKIERDMRCCLAFSLNLIYIVIL